MDLKAGIFIAFLCVLLFVLQVFTTALLVQICALSTLEATGL